MNRPANTYALPGFFLFWLLVLLVAGALFSGCAGFPRYPLINPGLGQETPHDDVYKAARMGDVGQAADLLTTVYALESLDYQEQNPLAEDMGTAGIVLFKIAGNWLLYEIARGSDPQTAKTIHYIRAVLGFAAAGYNASRF